MINNRLSTACGFLAVLTVLAAPVRAAEDTPNTGTQREFNAKMLVCDACHEAGALKNPAIPIIAGQQENYLIKQLHDFQSGDRNVEVMEWMSKSLAPDELRPATAHFAKKTWPAHPAATASAAPPRGIAVCQACHQTNFLGAEQAEGMTAPRLAGQRYEYLVEAMRRFADGERTNNADMVQIMKQISPADREAMARYLSNL